MAPKGASNLPFDFQYFPISSAVPVGGGCPEDGVVLLDEVGALGGRGGGVRGVARRRKVFRSGGVGGGVGAADDGAGAEVILIRSWSCNSDCGVIHLFLW